ncbi:L-serine ammonia-lyase, iron-sulfur-dependent, subunit alpha [Oscillibacter sp.]|uniref:L-cysteine desulfidase family protein n=1 Tax=Oscillibacter sp. TaxID=1945593 RepID=UPI003391BD4C
MNRTLICQILNHEMMLATGCTEPAAIALTAAVAREHLIGEPTHVKVLASVNIIKNAMAAGIPGTDCTGMNYAAALGAVCGRVDRQLQVVDGATPEDVTKAVELVRSGNVEMGRTPEPDKLYVEVELTNGSHQARAIIRGAHTNVTFIEEDHRELETAAQEAAADPITPRLIKETLSIQTIYDFVETLDREKDDVHMIEQAIKINSEIAKVGAEGSYGLNIGRHIRQSQESGLMGKDVMLEAVAVTSSAADARMAGANAPVVTNSGSGNQGITATMPIVSAAQSLGVGEERMFRAVTLSHLMSIHIHADFGLLSGLCGATIAATGAACGLVYLLGGSAKQIGYAVNNMLGDVTGMLCDGAKADCALKISTCVFTAFHCAAMALRDETVKPTDGIVEQDPEVTIANFVKLGNDGSPKMDDLVLDMLLQKGK